MIMSTGSRVLIVDDDAGLLEALPDALKLRMTDVNVDVCDSATCALDYIQRTDYDAIVSDIKMPGMDGLALLGELKLRRPQTPTLMITGHGEHDLAVAALRGGAYDFIQKPIDRDYFVASLRRAINMRQLSRTIESHQAALAELRVAREIQQRLFPAGPPLIDGFDVAGASLPASETSGDYYDYIPMIGGGIGIVIGDVSGHGFGPALLMADTRATLRALAMTCADVGDILTRGNLAILQDTGDEHFVTILYTCLNVAARKLSYASAGHTTAYILGASGDVRAELESTDMPLGIDANITYGSAGPVEMISGDTLLLMTDGILEAAGPDHEQFGAARALAVVRENRQLAAAQIVETLRGEVAAFQQGTPQRDDITAVVVKVL